MRRAAVIGVVMAALLAPAPAPAASPKVLDIVVDGLEPEEIGPATTPNLWKLVTSRAAEDRVTSYGAARAVMPSETNANHVAMMTGAYPNASGNFGDSWYDRASGQLTTGEDPRFLRAETLFTAVERQRPALETAAIFGKPKLGRIFSAGSGQAAPDYLWIPCKPGDTPPPGATCGTVPINPVTGYATDVSVMDEVLRTLDARRPDFLLANLPDVDSAGHAFTPGLPTYGTVAASADAQVGRLIDHLKQTGAWKDAVLLIHADHGMNSGLNRISLTSRFESAGLTGFRAFASTGTGGHDNVYLTDPGRPDAAGVLRRMRAIANSTPGVAEALYRVPNPLDGGDRFTLDARHPAWQYSDERVGDLVVTAESAYALTDPSQTSNPVPGNHGYPTSRAIPFIVAGGSPLVSDAGLVAPAGEQFEPDDTAANPNQAETTDVAPTVAALLGVTPPAQSQGRFLAEALRRPVARSGSRSPARRVARRPPRRAARLVPR